MNIEGKRVLVTGAGGFIGSHLAEALVARGATVRAFVRYNSRGSLGLLEDVDPEITGRMEIFFGDLEDSNTVRRAIEGESVVFHLGALIAIPYSYLHPADVVGANVLGTVNVLDACREKPVKKLVQMSTSEVYGTASYVPIDEAHPLTAQSPYAASKIGSDKLAESYHHSFGLPVAIARPFNNFGPRQSARAIIPSLISQALTGAEVKIGNQLPTRDFCFVKDTVAGIIAIAESEKTRGEVVNLGTGHEISMGRLAELIIEMVGRPVKLVTDAHRMRPADSEVERLVADSSKAGELLDWSARVDLHSGLEQTIDWVSRNISSYNTGTYNV